MRLADNIAGLVYVEVCPMCAGEGEYQQTYTAGCGGGYFQMNGPCGYCDELGIRMTDRQPVPPSVIQQIRHREPKP